MSQLRFDVLAVNAGNNKSRAVVPPDDPLVSEMFSPTLVRSASASSAASAGSPANTRVKTSRAARSTAATLGVTQLQASPLHAGKVLLRNAERFPVLYRVHILRTHATRKKRRTTTTEKDNKNGGGDEDNASNNDNEHNDADNEQDLVQQQHELDDDGAALYVHPVRGVVKPGKTRAIACLLPPPPPRAEDAGAASSSASGSKRTGAVASGASSGLRSTSPFPRRVTFAGDEDFGAAASPADLDSPGGGGGNARVLVRMQIEARVMLTGDLPDAVLEMKRKRDAEFAAQQQQDQEAHDGDDQEDDEDDADDQPGGVGAAFKSHHRDELELLHLHHEQWHQRWQQGLELPTRTIEVVSQQPEVTRADWLDYVIRERLLPRCDRLSHRIGCLVNVHETALRCISDFKAADREDKLRVVLRQSVVTVPLWLFAALVVAMFLVGLSF